ncbi:MAG: hypothetical protein KAH10_03800 [Flavobacteriales bacterium]|nr:hypothetical protein [Flavobacteriales bacterium]
MKNTFIYTILIALLTLYSCDSPINNNVKKIRAVPKKSVLLLETESLGDAFNSLEQNSLWNIAGKQESLKLIITQLRSLSNYLSDNDINLSDKEALISIHSIGLKSFDYLLYFEKDEFEEGDFDIIASNKKSSKEYDNAIIDKYEFSVLSSPIYTTDYKGLLIISRSIILLENSIRQLNSDKSLLSNPNFESIYESIDHKEDFNLLVNFAELNKINSFSQKKDFINWINNFAEWTELDFSPESDEIFCSGISSTNDSIGNYLGVFKKQKAQKITIDNLLPSSTAFSVVFGFDDFTSYNKSYLDYLRKHGELKRFEINIKKHNIKRSDLFDSWIDNQFAIASITSDNNDINYNDLVFIKSKDASLTIEALKVISDKSTYDFRGFGIRKVIKKGIFEDYLGGAFNKIISPYYAIVENVVIFSDNRKIIQNVLSDYLDGRSLSNYKHFQSLKDNLSSKSNVLFYYKNPDFAEFVSKVFPDLKPLIDSNLKEISKYKSGAVQIAYDDGNAYTNILIRQSNEEENEVKPVWELEFSSELYPTISTLTNHYSKNKEIAVQDKNNILYLISTSGKTLWSKKLSSKIIGEIKQVDLYRNRKLQMAFVTETHLYVLDRNGKNVANFPRKLSSNASAPLGVFDYSKSRDYRFVVAMGKHIKMYDKKGKTVNGFTFKKSSSTFNKEPQHFRIKGKDYIILSTTAGNIYVLDRRGNRKFNIKTRYPLGQNKFYLVENTSLSKSRIVTNTKNGELLSVFFNGSIDISKIDNFDEKTQYLKKGDQTVSLSRNTVKWSNHSSTEILDMEDSEFSKPRVYTWNKVHYLLFGAMSSNKVYLYDSNLNMQKGFPIYGQIVGKVADYNNNGNVNFPVIVNNEKGNLMMFSIN